MQFLKCEKSDLKDYIFYSYDSIHMHSRKGKHIETEDKHGFQGFGKGVVNYKGMYKRHIRVKDFFCEVLM